MKKIYLLGIILFAINSVYSQVNVEAKINFAHGMNGNGHSLVRLQKYMNSWQKVDCIVPTEIKTPVSYNTLLGIRSSAIELHDEIRNDYNYYSTPRRFIIAHSMGGLISRQWFNNYKASTSGRLAYNGIITLATPHKGTYVAQLLSTNEGRLKFDADMRTALNCVTEGAKKDAVNTISEITDNFWIKLVGNLTSFSAALEKMVNKMIGNVVEGIVNRISASDYVLENVAGSEKVLQDLAYDSPVITEINNRDINNTGGDYDTLVRKIALWGNETSPQVFKMMGASFFIDELGNSNYQLQTDCDMKLIEKLNKISAFCRSRADYNNSKVNFFTTVFTNKNYKEKAAAWERSADYVDTKFHRLFLQELGLQYAVYTPRTETVTTCAIMGSICTTREVTYYDSKIVTANNDGLVTEASQKYFNGAFKAMLPNINHEEMKMHQDIGDAMHSIFYGENFGEIRYKSKNIYEFYQLYQN